MRESFILTHRLQWFKSFWRSTPSGFISRSVGKENVSLVCLPRSVLPTSENKCSFCSTMFALELISAWLMQSSGMHKNRTRSLVVPDKEGIRINVPVKETFMGIMRLHSGGRLLKGHCLISQVISCPLS